MRPILPSAPYSPPPHTPFRPSVPSAPGSLPPHTPVLPILPSAPSSLPPHTPFRPMLPSAPSSRPPHARFRRRLPLRRCLPCVRVLGVSEFSPAEAKCGGAVRVSWLTSMRGACSAVPRLPDSSVAELPGGTSLRWSTPAPTANDLRQEPELTRFQVDRGSYATSSAPPTPTRPYSLQPAPPPSHACAWQVHRASARLTARRFGTCARLLRVGRAVAQAGGRAAWFFGKTLVFGFFVGIWYRTRRVRKIGRAHV